METTLLLADDDAAMRSLVCASMRDALDGLTVFEAADGAEAIRLGLQERPRLALLDVDMPRIDGIGAAAVLRELVPRLCLALYSGDVHANRERAKRLGLPLFAKSDLDRAAHWASAQAGACSGVSSRSLVCASCGYGVSRSVPPRHCPMCRAEDCWLGPLLTASPSP